MVAKKAGNNPYKYSTTNKWIKKMVNPHKGIILSNNKEWTNMNEISKNITLNEMARQKIQGIIWFCLYKIPRKDKL